MKLRQFLAKFYHACIGLFEVFLRTVDIFLDLFCTMRSHQHPHIMSKAEDFYRAQALQSVPPFVGSLRLPRASVKRLSASRYRPSGAKKPMSSDTRTPDEVVRPP